MPVSKEIYALAAAIAALVSTVTATTVSGWVSLRNSARMVQAQYITGERAKWRDRVRSAALEVHKAVSARDFNRVAELTLELRLLLNPKDPMDAEILDVVGNLQNCQTAQSLPSEFGERIALLLKHDWDRAKREAQPFFRRFSRASERISYEDFWNAECRRKNLAKPRS